MRRWIEWRCSAGTVVLNCSELKKIVALFEIDLRLLKYGRFAAGFGAIRLFLNNAAVD